MTSHPYRIVVGVDFSETGALALAEAVQQARWRAPAELHVTTVVDHQGRVEAPDNKDGRHSVEEYVARLQKTAAEAMVSDENAPKVFVHVRIGRPATELVHQATEVGADLLVIGTHGRSGLSRLWLGSIAERVVRLARTPVLMVRPMGAVEASDSETPQMEPACPRCVAVREASGGRTWLCPEHDVPAQRPRSYGYSSVFDVNVDPVNKLW